MLLAYITCSETFGNGVLIIGIRTMKVLPQTTVYGYYMMIRIIVIDCCVVVRGTAIQEVAVLLCAINPNPISITSTLVFG